MTDDVAEAPTDSELMARVAAGDHEAFATLYDRHVRTVYGAVLRYLRDAAAAEEVVQETYLAMWRQPNRYAADKGSLVGWLLSIARNRAIDRLRADSRRPLLVALDPGMADAAESDLERLMASGRPVGSGVTADEPSDVAERRWVQAVVRTALESMAEPERQVLVLAYDDGLTQKEIAERIGWPLGTVKTRTRRALLRLRAMLESVPDIGPWAAPTPVPAWGDPDGAQHGPH
jgi:RNA polymerase sigma-70 factor (ECF subfamily)